MKRMSLWLVLLALTPGIAEAYCGSYYGGVRYSPYAFTYRSSGLVPCAAEYTPYALNYRHSGLVEGYGYSQGSLNYGFPAVRGAFRRAGHAGSRGSRPEPSRAQGVSRPTRSQDGAEVIRRYLLAKGHDAVNMNGIMRIDNELISVDFFLKDHNLIIKYWNSTEIESLKAKDEFRQRSYERYRQNWIQIAARHEQTGGRIYYVEASDARMIVAALDSCTEWDTNPEETSRPVMYVKN